MKISDRKKKALVCLVWGLFSIAYFVWFMLQPMLTNGILLVIFILFFMKEDHEFKKVYPKKEEEEE